MRKSLSLLALALAVGCGGNSAGRSQQPAPDPFLNIPIATPAFAGQQVAVLPLTLAVTDAELSTDTLLGVRAKVLAWSDSLLQEGLKGRAPEVTWVGPIELRRVARRAVGLATDPDQLGHAILRNPLIKVVPDPLRSQIRTLVALTDARYVLAPTAEAFTRDTAGVKVELHLVMLDARTGMVGWRSTATGSGRTAALAFHAAMGHLLPLGGMP